MQFCSILIRDAKSGKQHEHIFVNRHINFPPAFLFVVHVFLAKKIAGTDFYAFSKSGFIYFGLNAGSRNGT